MNQAIAGVTPADSGEVTVMTVWPSIARTALGRSLGKLYAIKTGTYIFTLGNLFALATIPLALMLYFERIGPFIALRYRLTNRRIVVQSGMQNKESRSIELDRFDSIEIVVQDGQEWYDAGDLVFRSGKTEVFRLEGVSRPAAFRACCLKSWAARNGVKQSAARQLAHA